MCCLRSKRIRCKRSSPWLKDAERQCSIARRRRTLYVPATLHVHWTLSSSTASRVCQWLSKERSLFSAFESFPEYSDELTSIACAWHRMRLSMRSSAHTHCHVAHCAHNSAAAVAGVACGVGSHSNVCVCDPHRRPARSSTATRTRRTERNGTEGLETPDAWRRKRGRRQGEGRRPPWDTTR